MYLHHRILKYYFQQYLTLCSFIIHGFCSESSSFLCIDCVLLVYRKETMMIFCASKQWSYHKAEQKNGLETRCCWNAVISKDDK